MTKVLKLRFRKRYAALVLMASYIVFCQSCMLMRTSKGETKRVFEKARVKYCDSTLLFSGHKIHYIETGQGNHPTLFFIHGSPGSWDAFRRYLTDSMLLKKFRMVAIDRPGFGYSDFGKAEDLQTQSDLISEVIRRLKNNRPLVLIGHSLGGPVAAKIAIDNPDWNANLVILAGSVDPDAENPEKWRYYIRKKPFRWLIPGALRPSNDELWYFKSDLRGMRPELSKFTGEVTIIHGTADRLVPFSNVDFMNEAFTGAKSINTIAIKNANHFIPWEHFETIQTALIDLKL